MPVGYCADEWRLSRLVSTLAPVHAWIVERILAESELCGSSLFASDQFGSTGFSCSSANVMSLVGEGMLRKLAFETAAAREVGLLEFATVHATIGSVSDYLNLNCKLANTPTRLFNYF